MKKARKIAIGLMGVIILLVTEAGFAQTKPEEPKIADGIKAVFKVTPSQNMVDLLLTDTKTDKAITDAKVSAKIKGPDGKIQEKELMGMKMGDVFSYMNTMDMAKKGGYSFDILVEVGKKKTKFNFVYEVR